MILRLLFTPQNSSNSNYSSNRSFKNHNTIIQSSTEEDVGSMYIRCDRIMGLSRKHGKGVQAMQILEAIV